MDSGIYEIRNKITEDSYIGSAASLYNRGKVHWSNLRKMKHPSIHLQRTWNKFGELSFEFRILIFCDKKDLIKYEQYFINTRTPQYNLTKIAGSQLGLKHTEDARRKIGEASKSRRGIPKPKSYSEKLSKRMIGNTYGFGKKRSELTQQKMHQALLGNKHWLGKHHTEETKEKIRSANKGRVFSAETRQKMSESRKLYFEKIRQSGTEEVR